MNRGMVAYASGLLFAAGLCLATMTKPARILAFLDVSGSWDPSLALVMLGAIAVAAAGFRLSARRARPVLGESFDIPDRRAPVSADLVAGAALFGIGWGLSGLCPGPAVALVATGTAGAFVFVGAMIAGMALHRLVVGKTKVDKRESQSLAH